MLPSRWLCLLCFLLSVVALATAEGDPAAAAGEVKAAAAAAPAHYYYSSKCPKSCYRYDLSPQHYCSRCSRCPDWAARCGSTGCSGLPPGIPNGQWPPSCRGTKPGGNCKAVCNAGYFGNVRATCQIAAPPHRGYGVHTAGVELPQRPRASWSAPVGSCTRSLGGSENGQGNATLPPVWGGAGVSSDAKVAGGTVKIVNQCNMPLLAIFTINSSLVGSVNLDWRFLNTSGANVWTRRVADLTPGFGYAIKAWPLPIYDCGPANPHGCSWTCPACNLWSQTKGGPLSPPTDKEAQRRQGYMWTGDGPAQWNYANLTQWVPHCNPQQVQQGWDDSTLCAPRFLNPTDWWANALWGYGTYFEATFNNNIPGGATKDFPDLTTNYGYNATSPCDGQVVNVSKVDPAQPIFFNLPVKWETNIPCNVPASFPDTNGGKQFPCYNASCAVAYKCPVPKGSQETDKQISCNSSPDRGYVVTFCPDGHKIYDPSGYWPYNATSGQ